MKAVSPTTNNRVFVQIKNMPNATRAGIRKGFYNLGKSLTKRFSKDVLKKPKSGRIYRIRRGSTTRSHRASAAGETAANISGTYRKSVDFNVSGTDSMQFGSDLDYAEFLELGTKRMAPRPGLGNAVEAETANAIRYFEAGIQGEVLY